MKRFVALALLLTVSGFLAPAASARQDASYTSLTTFGIFEDMYDYFNYSPAYMASFKRNVLWSQFANLQNANDAIFAWAPSQSNYMIGTQMDQGFGRMGLVLDWWSATTAQSGTPYGIGSVSANGYSERTYEDYQDRDSNGNIDSRRETFGAIDNTDNRLVADIYAAYSLGTFAGFDTGLGVRLIADSNNPTYYGAAPVTGKGSFKTKSRDDLYDLPTGLQISHFEDSTTGSYVYGTTTVIPVIGARAVGLMPNMDLLVNIKPIIQIKYNDVKWEFNSLNNYAVSDPAITSDLTTTNKVTGIGDTSPVIPGTATGIGADARLDYAPSSATQMTGWVSFATTGQKYSNAKQEINSTMIDRDTLLSGTGDPILRVDNSNTVTSYSIDGNYGDYALQAKLRAIFPGKGWSFGLGINGSTMGSTDERTIKTSGILNFRHDSGTSIPVNNFSTTGTSGNTQKIVVQNNIDTLEFPLGIQFDITKELQFRLGAKHTVRVTANTTTLETKERLQTTVVQRNDDGSSQLATVAPGTNNEAYRTSSVSVQQYNELNYSATYWINDQVQIDFASFYNVLYLYAYRISLNIYF